MAGACNPSYPGGSDGIITWTQEAEVAVSQDGATVLQPVQQEQNSISKKKKTTKNRQAKNVRSVISLEICLKKIVFIFWSQRTHLLIVKHNTRKTNDSKAHF